MWWIDMWNSKILHMYLGLESDEIPNDSKEFLDDLIWIFDSIARSVFKRVQSVPLIITSKTAYGYDLRESILPASAYVPPSLRESPEDYVCGTYQ